MVFHGFCHEIHPLWGPPWIRFDAKSYPRPSRRPAVGPSAPRPGAAAARGPCDPDPTRGEQQKPWFLVFFGGDWRWFRGFNQEKLVEFGGDLEESIWFKQQQLVVFQAQTGIKHEKHGNWSSKHWRFKRQLTTNGTSTNRRDLLESMMIGID